MYLFGQYDPLTVYIKAHANIFDILQLSAACKSTLEVFRRERQKVIARGVNRLRKWNSKLYHCKTVDKYFTVDFCLNDRDMLVIRVNRFAWGVIAPEDTGCLVMGKTPLRYQSADAGTAYCWINNIMEKLTVYSGPQLMFKLTPEKVLPRGFICIDMDTQMIVVKPYFLPQYKFES